MVPLRAAHSRGVSTPESHIMVRRGGAVPIAGSPTPAARLMPSAARASSPFVSPLAAACHPLQPALHRLLLVHAGGRALRSLCGLPLWFVALCGPRSPVPLRFAAVVCRSLRPALSGPIAVPRRELPRSPALVFSPPAALRRGMPLSGAGATARCHPYPPTSPSLCDLLLSALPAPATFGRPPCRTVAPLVARLAALRRVARRAPRGVGVSGEFFGRPGVSFRGGGASESVFPGECRFEWEMPRTVQSSGMEAPARP